MYGYGGRVRDAAADADAELLRNMLDVMRAKLSRPPQAWGEVTPEMKALKVAFDAMNDWREEQEKQELKEYEEWKAYNDRYEAYFEGEGDPPICLSCKENVAASELGYDECWQCYGEH